MISSPQIGEWTAKLSLCTIFCIRLCYSANVLLKIDTDAPIYVTHPLSPSVAMGMGIFEYHWVDYFSNNKFMTLARALAPMYLRVGGTKADFTQYEPDKEDYRWKAERRDVSRGELHTPSCIPTDLQDADFESHSEWAVKQLQQYDQQKWKHGLKAVMKNITMTGQDWRKLNEFCHCAGWKLIFGLNLLERNGTNWNSGNAKKLISFSENRYHVNWELGNEPNSYLHKVKEKLSPQQVGKGFLRLKAILSKSPWWSSSIVLGPDANRIGEKDTVRFLKQFLNTAGSVINGLTFHQYDLNGRKATEEDFLNPRTLNKLIKQIQAVQRVVSAFKPKQPMWLGETASAYSGGAPGLSNSYLSGFTWLDKLGITSRMEVNMVIRQSFIQSNYDLVDAHFNPLPDYWSTLLYKRLVGSEVLMVNLSKCSNSKCFGSNTGHVRIYAHCANSERSQYRKGAVVINFINLRNRSLRLFMKPFNNVVLKTDMYLLEPSTPGNLTSKGILLNGNLLALTRNLEIPPILPQRLSPKVTKKGIRIPGHTYGFIVFTNANARACFG